ncbi:uncharacterized protein LOC113860049 isoform X4 [Abrus precatorius]|uniref:Uncharacterized protein LOC113860049 isoform X4 n=1 Tax=Abrus precatorius TaxID=3816 RepID=A0A8B8KX42_ABRPR|nr:uncharacterized protein LOC113860049 isoform X4 [Abrus precatorius]
MLEYDNCYMLCFPIFMTCQMSQDSRSLIASDKYERVGPDYFGYYSSEVLNLLSQDEGDFTVSTQTSEELPQNKYGEGINKNLVNHSDNCSGPLYSNGVGDGLSDFRKDRLRSLLRQSVIALSSEVDEVVDPVFATSHLQSKLRSKTHSLNPTEIASDDEVQIPCKLLKLSSSSPSASFLAQTRNVNPQCSTKLGYMEQRLELLLDAIMLKCRSMTLAEKQQLQRLIQKLPAGNLDRVAEIICRNRQVEERSCDEIFVDLEKEDNATLWRLYYYVEAVEKAKSLSSCEEA